MKMPEISMIVAMTPEGVIGNKGKMPWHLPRDLKRFVHFTNGAAVVMGPKTYASLPKEHRPLKGRLNIILTTNLDYVPDPGVLVAHDPKQALEAAAIRRWTEFYVIGGAMVYASFLEQAEVLRVTYVKGSIEGDTRFPYWDKRDWHQVWQEPEWVQEKNDSHPTRFAEWRRTMPPEPEGTQRSWLYPYKEGRDDTKDLVRGGIIAGSYSPPTQKIPE